MVQLQTLLDVNARVRIISPPPTPKFVDFLSEPGSERKKPSSGNLILLTKRVQVLEIAVGAMFRWTRFSLSRISIRHR